jgi:1-deoxy-D-xylulose-5-phosphate reductoisomerase
LRVVDPAVERFPALVRAVLASDGLAPAALRSANETAVAAFLDRRIGFLDIAATVAETLERMERMRDLRAGANANGALETAMAADRSVRRIATGGLAEPSL